MLELPHVSSSIPSKCESPLRASYSSLFPHLNPPHMGIPITPATSPPTPWPPSLSRTTDEVRTELGRLHPGKAARPEGVCPRLLKDCAAQLSEPLQRMVSLSLQMGRGSQLCGKHHILCQYQLIRDKLEGMG